MTPEQIEEHITDLTAWKIAAGEIIGRLVAYVALMEPEKEAVFRDFSSGGDYRLDVALAVDPQFLDIFERTRQHKDTIVNYARQIAE